MASYSSYLRTLCISFFFFKYTNSLFLKLIYNGRLSYWTRKKPSNDQTLFSFTKHHAHEINCNSSNKLHRSLPWTQKNTKPHSVDRKAQVPSASCLTDRCYSLLPPATAMLVEGQSSQNCQFSSRTWKLGQKLIMQHPSPGSCHAVLWSAPSRVRFTLN